MYETRFALMRRPFPATPDGSLYYPATEHEAVLAQLQRAIADNDGFAVVTGEPGTGKTLLGLVLLERLGDGVVSAFLTNSHFPDRAGLLQAILYDLGLPYEGGREQLLRIRLTEHLLTNCQNNKNTVLLVDEAQNLLPDHLEELRLLGNLEAGTRRALHVILLGQTALLGLLRQPAQAALRQRLAMRLLVPPLGVEESVDYLLHHLRIAGGQPERIIDEAALEVLARGTRGVPRLLNQAGHQAMLLADGGALPRVDAEAALEALAVLGLEHSEQDEEQEKDDIVERRWSLDVPEDLPVRLAEETRRPA